MHPLRHERTLAFGLRVVASLVCLAAIGWRGRAAHQTAPGVPTDAWILVDVLAASVFAGNRSCASMQREAPMHIESHLFATQWREQQTVRNSICVRTGAVS